MNVWKVVQAHFGDVCEKESLIKITLSILVVLNLMSFLTYWIDKSRAGRGKDRVSETRLLQLSFLGPLGSVAGIWWVRHKTRKTSFLLKYFPVLILSLGIHAAIAYYWLKSE